MCSVTLLIAIGCLVGSRGINDQRVCCNMETFELVNKKKREGGGGFVSAVDTIVCGGGEVMGTSLSFKRLVETSEISRLTVTSKPGIMLLLEAK